MNETPAGVFTAQAMTAHIHITSPALYVNVHEQKSTQPPCLVKYPLHSYFKHMYHNVSIYIYTVHIICIYIYPLKFWIYIYMYINPTQRQIIIIWLGYIMLYQLYPMVFGRPRWSELSDILEIMGFGHGLMLLHWDNGVECISTMGSVIMGWVSKSPGSFCPSCLDEYHHTISIPYKIKFCSHVHAEPPFFPRVSGS
jgi:hypothetical protein